jgi:hypothetical protein
MFNVSIVRIKYARSTIGYSEVCVWDWEGGWNVEFPIHSWDE